MIEFLKKLVSSKGRSLTVVIFDDHEPELSTSYKFRPDKLFTVYYLSLLAVVVIMLLTVMFTPLGTLVYNQEDEELRAAVIDIQQKVSSLRDSLAARDLQLHEIQQVLALGEDTTFEVNGSYGSRFFEDNNSSLPESELLSRVNTSEMISQNEIVFSGLLREAPEFPASYPVEGTFTRGYNPETGHFGIDIATKDDTPFRAVANGAVVNQDWTVNYGYVLHLQHSGGLISVYKHASSVSRSPGDIILKGDILGTTGDTGVMSSGPHLHLEIWKNGVPQNPISYLIKS